MIIRKANKKRKEEVMRSQISIAFIGLGIILLLLFVGLQPRVSSAIFPVKRDYRLQQFLSTATTNQAIDPQRFWQFRETYSPGYVEFSREGFSKKQLSGLPVASLITDQDQPFLIYRSPHLMSIDFLTSHTSLSSHPSFPTGGKTLFENENERIYTLNNGNILIIFLKPFEEMKKANGYFDYTDKDKNLDQSKKWLNITFIPRR